MEEVYGETTGRKIEVLQFDNIEKYNRDYFLQFGKNNGISIHFRAQKKIRVAKELNRALLEKIWYLLFNTQLDKSFWAETLVYAGHLMNSLSSTVIEDKAPLDIWSDGVTQYYSLLRV